MKVYTVFLERASFDIALITSNEDEAIAKMDELAGIYGKDRVFLAEDVDK